MRRNHAWFALVACTLVLILNSSPRAQENSVPARMGLPQDWTYNHIAFTRDGLLHHPEIVYSEPRVLHQAMQRWAIGSKSAAAPGFAPSSMASEPQRDWSVSLNLGRVAANMFPAKYSFDPAKPPDCVNDYVVFGLSRVGGANQANLIAFNQLYSGTNPNGICGTGGPSVQFAYNISTVTAGRILTSPTLSLDGTKIAFVESGNIAGNPTSIFHVLKWATGAGNGTAANAPAVPGVGNTAVMTSLTFAAALDTRSSPWVDYTSDTAYVGADDGRIYKIVNVFNGTPALAGAPWPVTVSANVRASSPVLDNRQGQLLVGSQNGTLYAINISNATVRSLVVGRSGGTNPGILHGPVVDVVNRTAYVVTANDGVSGALVQVDTVAMAQLAKARIGLASRSGTAVSLFQPALSNDYFTDPQSGLIRVCGTGAADITPWQYAIGFTGTTMNSAPAFSAQLVTSVTARCTGWTEFFNPNVGVGGTDFFFFGLTAECSGAATPGCVVARNANGSLTTFNVTGGPSGVVIDNYSTDAQASSIYFGGVQAPNLAFKLTQNGLQ